MDLKRKKIYFAGAWGYPSEKLTNIFKRQTINNSGVWENIECVSNKEIADYILIQDQTDEKIIKTNPKYKSKVIFFGREPRHIGKLEWSNCYKVFHHEKGNSWMPQTWWVNLPFDELKKGKIPEKNKNLSVIDSGKRMVVGHNKRLRVINQLINKHPNKIDIYGKITMGKKNNNVFKKPLPDRAKEDGLLDYRYNLACENGRTDFYFSEKIVDALLCWCMPIYWGCKNIDKFLPEGSYINIDLDDKNVVEKIIEISESNYREDNIEKIREARDLILNKYNIWPTIKLGLESNNLLKNI